MRAMFSNLKFLLIFSLLVVAITAGAQSGDSFKNFKPVKTRELFHDYVDKEKRSALRADGKVDNQFTLRTDDDINYLVTLGLTQKVDQLQYKIEKDTTIIDRKKVAYLRGIENMLKAF